MGGSDISSHTPSPVPAPEAVQCHSIRPGRECGGGQIREQPSACYPHRALVESCSKAQTWDVEYGIEWALDRGVLPIQPKRWGRRRTVGLSTGASFWSLLQPFLLFPSHPASLPCPHPDRHSRRAGAALRSFKLPEGLEWCAAGAFMGAGLEVLHTSPLGATGSFQLFQSLSHQAPGLCVTSMRVSDLPQVTQGGQQNPPGGEIIPGILHSRKSDWRLHPPLLPLTTTQQLLPAYAPSPKLLPFSKEKNSSVTCPHPNTYIPGSDKPPPPSPSPTVQSRLLCSVNLHLSVCTPRGCRLPPSPFWVKRLRVQAWPVGG